MKLEVRCEYGEETSFCGLASHRVRVRHKLAHNAHGLSDSTVARLCTKS